MSNLDQYWQLYDKDKGTGATYGEFGYHIPLSNSTGGFLCSDCGLWVNSGEHHYCHPSENKAEQAFKILKVLVEEKIIKEPTSFKKFCDLVEKLAKVI